MDLEELETMHINKIHTYLIWVMFILPIAE